MQEQRDPIVVLFDLDGTLADYSGELNRRLARMHSPHEPPLDRSDFVEDPEHLKERIALIKTSPGFWLNLPPLAAGFEILEEANARGLQIEVLTKGPRSAPIAWMEKLQWCDRHLSRFPHQVTITMDKGLVYGRVLVDDYPDYIMRWLKWRKRGVVIMPDQPWNAGFEHPQVVRYCGDRARIGEVLDEVVAAR